MADPTNNGEVDILLSKVYGRDDTYHPIRVVFGVARDEDEEYGYRPVAEIRDAEDGTLLKKFL